MWKPVVVGVDPSPPSAVAAKVGLSFAERAATECHLVHAVESAWPAAEGSAASEDAINFNRVLANNAQEEIRLSFRKTLGADAASDLRVEIGRPQVVLSDVVHELDAGILVLGGKHHSAISRWFGGSTAQHVVRTVDVPILVTASESDSFDRILVALDLSYAAAPTLHFAEQVADLFGADLKVLHAVEPLPPVPELPAPINPEEFFSNQEHQFEERIGSRVTYGRSESTIKHGPVATTICKEVADWGASLLVVGSHGKGWVDRILMGSTTERILNHLPSNTLIVPVPAPENSKTR